jgi:hypothetical protein
MRRIPPRRGDPCAVPSCTALADVSHPRNKQPRTLLGPFCAVHLAMEHAALQEVLQRALSRATGPSNPS